MTRTEFEAFRRDTVRGYADAHVAAGDWDATDAESRSEEETATLLPAGVDTRGMRFVVAESEGSRVGHAWVCLDEPGRRRAWIYDIEIEAAARGRGYGRALLLAVEELVKNEGVGSIGLNVFGPNVIARSLYESAGYETSSLHMLKRLA